MTVEIKVTGDILPANEIRLGNVLRAPTAQELRMAGRSVSTPVLQMGSSVLVPGLAVSIDV